MTDRATSTQTAPPSTTATGPQTDVSGLAWTEHVVVDLSPDWPALRALTRFAAALVVGAVVGELLAGAAGGLAGAMTTFTAYVTTAALLSSRRPNRKDAR